MTVWVSAVIAGDLNVTRDDRDLRPPGLAAETHVTPQARSRLEAILTGAVRSRAMLVELARG